MNFKSLTRDIDNNQEDKRTSMTRRGDSGYEKGVASPKPCVTYRGGANTIG